MTGFWKRMRQPSAFLPVALSGIALGVVLYHVTVYGAAREADEGSAAHVFQLLMAGQVPIVAYFAARGLRRDPRGAWPVLAVQAGAALAALALVFLLNL